MLTTKLLLLTSNEQSDSSPYGEYLFTSGSGTFIIPHDVTEISALAIGGGGGGGGTRTQGGSPLNNDRAGSGGGAGGTTYSNNIPVYPGLVMHYVVGDGGAGSNVDGARARRGGTSTLRFTSSTGEMVISAFGGEGGIGGRANHGQPIMGGSGGDYVTTPFSTYGGIGRSGGTSADRLNPGLGARGSSDGRTSTIHTNTVGSLGSGGDGRPFLRQGSLYGGDGINGVVRIVWGTNRFFPNDARE